MRFPEGTHELYQLPVGVDEEGEWHDALGDPRSRASSCTSSAPARPSRRATGRSIPLASRGFAALGRELQQARTIGAEQSNTLDRLRRRADPQGVPPARGGREPGARDAPLPHRARLPQHRRARRLVRLHAAGRSRRRSGSSSSSSPSALDGWELALDELARRRSASSRGCAASAR